MIQCVLNTIVPLPSQMKLNLNLSYRIDYKRGVIIEVEEVCRASREIKGGKVRLYDVKDVRL